MIQKSPISNKVHSSKENTLIWFQGYRNISLVDLLENLYKETSQLNRTIYGVKIYKKKQEDGNKRGSKQSTLEKIELENKTKHFITWCYLVLNWEYLSIQSFDYFTRSLPESQNQIQQIRIQGDLLKFHKFERTLTLKLRDLTSKTEDNKYYLDSFDREGKGQMLEYSRSLCKINIGQVAYRFDGIIKIVQSCEGFVAVSTSSSVFIISLKHNSGKYSKFDIERCIDMKWGQRGLYYLLQNGTLGLLERQTTFVPKLNQFTQHKTLQLSSYMGKEYIPQRIAVSNPGQANSNVIVMAVSSNNKRKILLQVVDNAKYGMRQDSTMSIEIKQAMGDIMYKNLLYIKGELKLIVINGCNGQIDAYHEYSFGTL